MSTLTTSCVKKVGRPKQFDRGRALLSAVTVFRKFGYEGASMRQLTKAMGASAPSLYAEFGDKHSLFLHAIDQYVSHDACSPLKAFESEPDIRGAVRAFFSSTVMDIAKKEKGTEGCFLGSCVATAAGKVEGAQERLQAAISQADTRLSARFEQEKSQGNLPQQFDCLSKAKMMFNLRQGLMLRARAGFDQHVICSSIDELVGTILG